MMTVPYLTSASRIVTDRPLLWHAGGRAGVDLEVVESRAPSFARTWFRETERHLCQGDPRLEPGVGGQGSRPEGARHGHALGLVEVLDVAEGQGSVGCGETPLSAMQHSGVGNSASTSKTSNPW